jgi:hypothetical protein
LLHDIPSSSYRPPFLRYNVKVKGMEGNLEAVPHIDHLREIQPLVLEGLSYSKVPLPSRLYVLHVSSVPLQALLLQLIAFLDEKIQNLRSVSLESKMLHFVVFGSSACRGGGHAAQGYEQVPTTGASSL